jgi:uncharacterized protein (TIGR00297 family)
MASMQLFQVMLGVVLAAVVAVAAYRLKTLSHSGAWGAFALGVVVFGFGGLRWAAVLLVFFVTSSGLSRFMRQLKKEVEEQFSKGSRRDAWQVAANGGVAGLAVLIGVFFPASIVPWVVFTAAIAAATADTWATELGVLSRRWPRNIRNFQQVPPGTSGGISAVGMLAATGGAALIALTAWFTWPVAATTMADRSLYALVIIAAGVTGSLIDSLLGATVQAIYRCPVCEKATEKHPLHTCGNRTIKLRGWKWMNNDAVNLVCTGSSALIALVFALIIL